MRPDIYAQQRRREPGKKARRDGTLDTAPLEVVGESPGVDALAAERRDGEPRGGTFGRVEREENNATRGAAPRAARRGASGENVKITADRPIFTLSVAADLLGLHPRTLRIYEEKKLVVPARTDGNRRRYSQNDINRFQAIRQLTRGGVNLEGVRIILEMADELRKHGVDTDEIIERNLQALDEW